MSESTGRHAADQSHGDNYEGPYRGPVPSGRHHRRVEAQSATPEATEAHNSPESADRAPVGSELVERFRTVFAGVEGAGSLSADDLHQAIELARAGLEDEIAQELVGSFHRLNATALELGNHQIEPALAELKQAVYHNPNVQPVHLEEQLAPGARRAVLHKQSHTFEWTGLPIILRVAGAQDKYDPAPDTNPNANIKLTLGPDDIWYKQIGDQRPEPLPGPGSPVKTLTLGRAPHGMEGAPNTLGMSNNTSREHLILEAMPPVGVQVTDTSTLGTHFETDRYPTPSEYRAQIAATAEDARQSQITNSRQQIEHHRPDAGNPDQPADGNNSAAYDAWYR